MTVNIGELLTRQANLNPDKEALVETANGRRFSYRELNGRSNRVANGLHALELAKGDRVGLLLMNSTEFVESFFAVGKVGGVIVPLNWRLVADELEFILSDAGTSVLIFGAEFAELAAELRGRDSTPIEHWIQAGGESAEGVVGYDDWLAAQSDAEPAPIGTGDDLMFIMYTSGTTGLPKGVIHSHNTVLWSLLTIMATSDFRNDDRYLNTLPMFKSSPTTCRIIASGPTPSVGLS